MQTKIDPAIWENIEDATPETKLAVFWMLTNSRLDAAGYCKASMKRFEFETGLTSESFHTACQALGKGLVPVAKGYWLRNYIRRQIGPDGETLSKNYFSRTVAKILQASACQELIDLVLQEYPSLERLFSSSSSEKKTPSEGLAKPLASPKEKEIEKEIEKEKEIEGFPRENQNLSSPENKNPRAPGDIVPAPELLDRLGKFYHREKTSALPKVHDTEMASMLKASEKELATVEAFYRIAMAEPKTHYPKKSLSALLASFPDELDKARGLFAQEPSLSPEKKIGRGAEPEGWREAVLAKFPNALVHEFRSFWDLDRDIRKEFPQFQPSAKTTASAPASTDRAATPAAA